MIGLAGGSLADVTKKESGSKSKREEEKEEEVQASFDISASSCKYLVPRPTEGTLGI